MPSTQDETAREGATPPAPPHSPDGEAAAAEVLDADIVADAEGPDAPGGDPGSAAGGEPDGGVDAEVLEGDASDSETESAGDADADADGEPGEGKRPSVQGKLAKPHKAKKDGAAKAKKPKRARKPGFARRVLLGAIVAVLAAILVGTGLFCWQKWMRYDDAADIQGVWKVQATGDTIVFDGRNLKLTKGISYEYRLDTDEKAIAYSFGNLEGGGHYYFAADRETLVIMDGDGRLDVLAEVGFLPAEVLDADDAQDEMTVLAKVSGDTSAEPSGTATGIGKGSASGEREYVVKPEPSTSSSSKKKASKSSSSSSDGERRGFVDEDGDGYDDETGLEYDDFIAYQEELYGEAAGAEFVDEDEDGYDDATGLDWEDFQEAYGLGADAPDASDGGEDGDDDLG